MNNLTKWVRIARTGTFTDSRGREHTFTAQDLETIRAGYDPEKQEAALCFGHPKDSDPAFGWVHQLKREGGELFAQFAQVPAEVKKLVDNGHYRHVSMSLGSDKKRLLHVGLLGASAPAMEGLGAVSFSEAEDVTINFSAEQEAETTLTRPEGAAAAALSDKAGKGGFADFASGPPPERKTGGNMSLEELQKQVFEMQKQIAALTAENEKLKAEKGEADKGKADAEKQAADAVAEFSAFKGQLTAEKRKERVAALVKSGRLEPAKVEETVSFAAALAQVGAPVSFSAADGKTEEVSAEERYFRELEDKEPSALALDFSAMAGAPAHAGANAAPAVDLSDITSKL